MEGKIEPSKISIELSKKLISCCEYTLKVPNYFTLPLYKEHIFDIDTPSFEFENASWRFLLYSSDIENQFSIDIVRITTEIPEHVIYFKVSLLDATGVKYDDFSYVREICTYCTRSWLWTFINDRNSDGNDTLTLIIRLSQFEATEVDAMQEDSAEKTVGSWMEEHEMAWTKKTVPYDFCSLKLPNLFISPEYEGKEFDISSPSIQFAKTTCCFHVCACTDETFAVRFEMLNAEIPLQPFFVKCTFLDDNGEIIDEDLTILQFTDIHQNARFIYHECLKPSFCTLLIHIFAEEVLEIDANPAPTMWDEDLELLSQDFKKLFLNGIDCDLTLKVAEKEFRVHRAILKGRSQVFETMLNQETIEKNKGIIDIPDINAETMNLLLNYIYNGEVDSLNQDNVLKVHDAADKYKMIHLRDKCSEFLKNNLH